LKQRVGGEVGSDHGSATTGDSGRGPSEDSAVPPTDDGNHRLLRGQMTAPKIFILIHHTKR